MQLLPLTENIRFQARLEKGNRVQVPKPLRQRFAFDSSQVLTVSVRVIEANTDWQEFYAHMDKSGRITIPKLTLNLLFAESSAYSLAGVVFAVDIEP